MVKSLPPNAVDMGSIDDPGGFHMFHGDKVHEPQLLSGILDSAHHERAALTHGNYRKPAQSSKED